jgi:hypothetical protein
MNRSSIAPKPRRRAFLWTALVLSLLVIIAAIGFDVMRRAAKMQPAALSVAAVQQAQPGKKIKTVVRLVALTSPGVYAAKILESTDGSVYRETPAAISIAYGSDTAVVMGAAADIKAGAIVEATGPMEDAGTLRARQFVILSGFVRIAPGG